MTKRDFYKQADLFSEQLQVIDFDKLPISDYNKNYIKIMGRSFRYYCRIFADILFRSLNNRNPNDITLIDFGGGAGFLSILAKKCGFKEVIYVDRNPLSVQTTKYLKENCFNIGADIIIEGDTKNLIDYIKQNDILPDTLVATDLIEHIYDLNDFFSDLMQVNPKMKMIFTTGSTPFNPIKKRKLRKIMNECEKGTRENPNYYTLRFDYINENYPHFSDNEKILWSETTRGLIFEDIDKAVKNGRLPIPADKYNTCDPRNGNWEERILKIRDYRKILNRFNYKVKVYKGMYNSFNISSLKHFAAKIINFSIKILGPVGVYISPMIILCISPKNQH